MDGSYVIRPSERTRVTILDPDLGECMELGNPNVTDKHVYGDGDPDRLTEGTTYWLLIDGEDEMATHVPHRTGTTQQRLKFTPTS